MPAPLRSRSIPRLRAVARDRSFYFLVDTALVGEGEQP